MREEFIMDNFSGIHRLYLHLFDKKSNVSIISGITR